MAEEEQAPETPESDAAPAEEGLSDAELDGLADLLGESGGEEGGGDEAGEAAADAAADESAVSAAQIEKLKEIARKELEVASFTWNQSFGGKEVAFADLHYETLSPAAFAERYGGTYFAVALAIDAGGTGKTYYLFDEEGAHIIIGSLMMLEEDKIKESFGTELSSDDNDALGEAANHLAGSLSTALREMLNADLNLVRELPTVLDTGEDAGAAAALFGDKDIVVVEEEMTVATFGPKKVLRVFDADSVATLSGGGGPPAAAVTAGTREIDLSQFHENLERAMQIKLPVVVDIAEKNIFLEEVFNLKEGGVLVFDKPVDSLMNIMVNNQKIGTGEVIIIGEKFGVQVKTILSKRERIASLHGR